MWYLAPISIALVTSPRPDQLPRTGPDIGNQRQTPEVHLAVHQRPAAAVRLHHRDEGGEIPKTGRFPFDRYVNELEPQASHHVVLMSDCLGVVGKCQKNDPVVTGRCDQRQFSLSRLAGGRQRWRVIYSV